MNPLLLAVFLVTAGVNAAAQLLIKKGAIVLAPVLSGGDSLLLKAARMIMNPFVLAGAALLGLGMLLWIKVVSQVELSRAYPVNIALTVIITTLVSVVLFQEGMTFVKLAGIALTLAGVWMVFAG